MTHPVLTPRPPGRPRRASVLTSALLLLVCSGPQSRAAPPPVRTAITLHTDKPGAHIPADFVGLSCEKKILTRDCFHPDNTVLINLFRSLGVGVLRVGANEADSTFWSRTHSAPLGSMQENRYSEAPATIGPACVDHLLGFAKNTGWRLIYGLNLATNDPAMATDEAAYVHQKAGSALLALEIGNEPNLYPKSAKREGVRPSHYAYPQYRGEFGAYADSIRTQTPSAPLTGPATTRICKWFPDFVTEFKNRTALITSHLYLLSAKEEDPKSPRFASIENLLTRKVEEEWLPQLEASKAAGVPFRLAECNTASGGGKRGVSDAFASALWALDFLFDVAEHGGAGVNLHGGFTPGNYSPICYLRKEQRYEPSPIYYGMLLFHKAARGRVIKAERDTEARLAIHATLGDDQRLRVVLINKDLTVPITASITAASMGAGAQLIRLSAPSPDSTTGVTLAGSAVAPDGTWKPQPSELLPCKDGRCAVTLPSASAALLTIDPR